jgi:hypothetical protein
VEARHLHDSAAVLRRPPNCKSELRRPRRTAAQNSEATTAGEILQARTWRSTSPASALYIGKWPPAYRSIGKGSSTCRSRSGRQLADRCSGRVWNRPGAIYGDR